MIPFKESLLIKDLKRSLNEMLVVRNFFFTSVLYIFQQALIGLFIISFSAIVMVILDGTR